MGLSDGLISYLDMDELDGSGNPVDSGSAENSWNASGGTTQVDGWIGKAFSFDGIDDFIYVLSPAGLPVGADSRTIAFWVKDEGSSGSPILFNYGTVAGIGERWSHQIVSGRLRISIGGGYTENSTGPLLDDGEWHHTAVVYDNSQGTSIDSVVIYIDGSEQTNTANSTVINTLNNLMEIGIFNGLSSPAAPFKGQIDDFRMYDRALTSDEVSALYAWRPFSIDNVSLSLKRLIAVSNNQVWYEDI